VLDALCLAIFVAAGRQSHDLQGGASWFFIVLWPLLAGWFLVAVAAQLYTSGTRPLVRLGATVVIGVAIAIVLRVAVTHRDSPVAFVVVAYVFIAVLTAGWRAAAIGVRALRRRAAGDPQVRS